MWLKLCFLLLYFLLLFVLARVFEAVVWYETGFFATQLVDPVALSFRKLRTILECRGLGHSGLPEKKDVRELVEKSGRGLLLPSGLPASLLPPFCHPLSLLPSLQPPSLPPSLHPSLSPSPSCLLSSFPPGLKQPQNLHRPLLQPQPQGLQPRASGHCCAHNQGPQNI